MVKTITVELLELSCEVYLRKEMGWICQSPGSKRFKKNQINFFMKSIFTNSEINPAAKLVLKKLAKDLKKSL
jgi:hypothetical protein